jgi:hypothetical protein
MKGQNEKNGLLESKLELSEERLRVVEYENKILKQEIEALKLTMTIDKTQPLEMNLNKDGAYQRKETVTKKPKTKTLDSIIKNGTQGDDPENDLYYD